MISSKQDKAGAGAKVLKVGLRIACLLAVAAVIAATLNRTAAGLSKDPSPAGLGRGVLQGALMPLALPNLAMGRDVVIYSLNNTGRTYKLGYTLGVNVCGLVFFGIFFWRVSRWRRSQMPVLKKELNSEI